jgi:hypothetical protein
VPEEYEGISRILQHPNIAGELRIEHPYRKPVIAIVNILGMTVLSEVADSPIHVMSVHQLPSGFYSILIGNEILPLIIAN